MRILYVDIDSLRPDHLGCYGYHRDTSPNIDDLARRAVRFNNCYVSDAPCLPSRSALFAGRFGIHNGVVNHGGVASEPFLEGRERGFRSTLGQTCWPACLRRAGLQTVAISPFGERHSAWHWYAGFNEIHNTGGGGMEGAEEVSPVALDWIARNGREDDWFVHLNLWDPHTPYRAPAPYADFFADEPLPAWLTDEVRAAHWNGCGPHSAREVLGWGIGDYEASLAKEFPRQPTQMASMDDVRMMFDGYDAGVRYADAHLGRVLNALADAGVLDETAIIVSSDHGENLGELNIYGDHQTADHITSRVPLLFSWPSLTRERADDGLIYNLDVAATTIQLAGGEVPDNWDGQGFAAALKTETGAGRESLVVSQMAWSCQRAVRFDDYICIRSYHDGYHLFPDVMLFDVKNDPHQQHDLAPSRLDLVGRALTLLSGWEGAMLEGASGGDPLWTVMQEGGPFHTREMLPSYSERLRATGRGERAEALAARHPRDLPCAVSR